MNDQQFNVVSINLGILGMDKRDKLYNIILWWYVTTSSKYYDVCNNNGMFIEIMKEN